MSVVTEVAKGVAAEEANSRAVNEVERRAADNENGGGGRQGAAQDG